MQELMTEGTTQKETLEKKLAEVRKVRDASTAQMNEAVMNVHRCNGAEYILVTMIKELEDASTP